MRSGAEYEEQAIYFANQKSDKGRRERREKCRIKEGTKKKEECKNGKKEGGEKEKQLLCRSGA